MTSVSCDAAAMIKLALTAGGGAGLHSAPICSCLIWCSCICSWEQARARPHWSFASRAIENYFGRVFNHLLLDAAAQLLTAADWRCIRRLSGYAYMLLVTTWQASVFNQKYCGKVHFEDTFPQRSVFEISVFKIYNISKVQDTVVSCIFGILYV